MVGELGGFFGSFFFFFNCGHMTGYSDILFHYLHFCWFIVILPVLSSVEIKTRGQRSILMHFVQHVSHSFVEEVAEELFIT